MHGRNRPSLARDLLNTVVSRISQHPARHNFTFPGETSRFPNQCNATSVRRYFSKPSERLWRLSVSIGDFLRAIGPLLSLDSYTDPRISLHPYSIPGTPPWCAFDYSCTLRILPFGLTLMAKCYDRPSVDLARDPLPLSRRERKTVSPALPLSPSRTFYLPSRERARSLPGRSY